MELFLNQFDQHVIEECQHFLRDPSFLGVMRTIQSVSALIFFVLVHMPLAKISSLFAILTALIPMFLDKKVKQQIFLGVYFAVFLGKEHYRAEMQILRKDQNSSELAQRFKPRKYEELRDYQKRAIGFTVFYVGLFFAVLFNYVLTLYMGRAISYSSEMSIRFFDKLGFEVHFVRLLYNTIFDVDLHERHHYPGLFTDLSLVLDLVFLLAIILPLFVLSLRYLTWP